MEEIRKYLNEEIERSFQLGHYIAGMHDRDKHEEAFRSHQNAIKRDRQVLYWIDELEGKESHEDTLKMDEVVEWYQRRIENKRAYIDYETQTQMSMYGEIRYFKPYIEGNKREMATLQTIVDAIEELRRKRAG